MSLFTLIKAMRTPKVKDIEQMDMFNGQGYLFDQKVKLSGGETKQFGDSDTRKFDAEKHRWVSADEAAAAPENKPEAAKKKPINFKEYVQSHIDHWKEKAKNSKGDENKKHKEIIAHYEDPSGNPNKQGYDIDTLRHNYRFNYLPDFDISEEEHKKYDSEVDEYGVWKNPKDMSEDEVFTEMEKYVQDYRDAADAGDYRKNPKAKRYGELKERSFDFQNDDPIKPIKTYHVGDPNGFNWAVIDIEKLNSGFKDIQFQVSIYADESMPTFRMQDFATQKEAETYAEKIVEKMRAAKEKIEGKPQPKPEIERMAEKNAPKPKDSWDTSEMQQEFNVIGFMAPYVAVERRSDGVRGSLTWKQENGKRIYYDFVKE